ncbi:MAG: HAD-IB family hydrolase, partial [Actinomycetota bacterium]|nr:HAD-IB family hydrolase [Actinomycetota bacterium]
MGDLSDRIDEIEAGPAGPQIAAFFDFDGTLIAGYSGTELYRARLRAREVGPVELARTLVAVGDMRLRGADVDGLMRTAVAAWEGRQVDEMEDFAERLMVQRVAGLLYPEALELIDTHRKMGHTLVLASSATRYQVAPLARELLIDEILCTEVEVVNGAFTGKLAGPIRWGEGKADAVWEFAEQRGIDLQDSYGYGNGTEDVAFLETVGRPRPLNPEPGLRRVADEHGWPVTRLTPRPGTGVRPLLRTGAALAGLGTAAWIAVGVGLLNRSRRVAGNVAAGIGCDLALALAGVELEVVGAEHLWSHRPAVFLFNHQSALDTVVLGSLLRRDFTGVAKKEAARDPLFAPFGALLDVVYIDRANSRKAREALQPVVDRLRDGVSIAIAPEGTRTPTPRLRPFKKGAFHIAMQAGVPLVPIVLRNAGQLMWRGDTIVHPGTLQVAVLEPIPTRRWRVRDLDDHVADVRGRFQATLEHWPAGDGPPAPRRRRGAPSARRDPAPAR